MRTKEEYENLLNNSPLFDIDKERDFAKYDTERKKLLAVILDYYRFYIYEYKNLDGYGSSLMATADNCIKAYEKENGEILVDENVIYSK